MYVCHACGYDFREAERILAFFPDGEIQQILDEMLLSLAEPPEGSGQFDLGFYAVVHQLCRVMMSGQNLGKLQAFVADQLELPHLLPTLHRACFERWRRDERHQLLLCVLWLMAELEPRLESAWRAKAVRYNLMLKDFDESPRWYSMTVDRFSNWRLGLV